MQPDELKPGKAHPLSEAEEEWMGNLYGFVLKAAGASDGLSIEQLQDFYDSWIETGEPQVEDPNIMINAAGVALGQLLSESLQIDWCIYEDQYGTDLALHTPANDVTLFPLSSVAKRFERRETSFLVGLYHGMVNQVNELRRGGAR